MSLYIPSSTRRTIISPQNRFIIASEVSKRRETDDAKAIFESGKKKTESNPSFVITDSLRAYEPAFRKEFNIRKTAHVKTKSIAEGFANRPIERCHNEVRTVLKPKRGLDNEKSAQEFVYALIFLSLAVQLIQAILVSPVLVTFHAPLVRLVLQLYILEYIDAKRPVSNSTDSIQLPFLDGGHTNQVNSAGLRSLLPRLSIALTLK
jgi:DDE domain